MTPFISGVLGIFIIVLVIIYYNATKRYSIRYKAKAKIIARIVLMVNSINVLMFVFIPNFINTRVLTVFIITSIITLFASYAILKGYLRTGQSLADKNWLRGSSYLKGKFKWSNINWKLIFLANGVLFLWTILVLTIGDAQVNSDLVQEATQVTHWTSNLNVILTIFILGPINEEILYRFLGINVILHWFGKNKMTIVLAILIPTVIWTFLHTGMLTNNWVKYIQIFPLGLVCGYMAYKKDLEHSILTHMIFNVVAVASTYFL